MVFSHPDNTYLTRRSNERILRAFAKVHMALDRRPSFWRGIRDSQLEAIEDPVVEAAKLLVQRLTEEELIGEKAPPSVRDKQIASAVDRLAPYKDY